jgi:uncharacterized protein (TIGR00730 family)
MKICVFGAASNEINNNYIERTESLCQKLAKNGHDLVFGAGANGLMGAAARRFKKGGGKIIGVIPHFFKNETVEAIYDKCDEIIYTESMRERKHIMEDKADAFVIAPGGIGTFEEFFEVLTLKQLARHKKPIVFYDIYGYYNKLMDFMEYAAKERFIRENCKLLYQCTDDDAELIEYLENTNIADFTVHDMKQG